MSKHLAVASLSARMLAEAARDGGYRPIALDLFGDTDTRRAADAWLPIGDPARLAIDGEALLAALRRLERQGAAAGWIAGSGFEGQPEVLAAGARILPLIGNSPAAVAQVRTPSVFFSRLAAVGIPHPETRLDCPPAPSGWLRKDAGSSGGWEVRPAKAAAGAHAPGTYYQRIAPGVPMSALFIADGVCGRLLGVNLQIARRLGGRPYVFCGCIGPVYLPPGVRRRLGEAIHALVEEFGLRGVNGLDFLLDGDRISVLELNPRPPASIALYHDALAGGLVHAHLAASLTGRLPAGQLTGRSGPVRGFEVVFARRRCRLGTAARTVLSRLSWCHDLPAQATRLAWGEPVCTVSATAGSIAAVQVGLGERRRLISSLLEQDNGACTDRPALFQPEREFERQ